MTVIKRFDYQHISEVKPANSYECSHIRKISIDRYFLTILTKMRLWKWKLTWNLFSFIPCISFLTVKYLSISLSKIHFDQIDHKICTLLKSYKYITIRRSLHISVKTLTVIWGAFTSAMVILCHMLPTNAIGWLYTDIGREYAAHSLDLQKIYKLRTEWLFLIWNIVFTIHVYL